MDLWQRRAALEPAPNPDRNIDYVSTLRGGVAALNDRVQVTLRYVPDASVIQPDVFAAYLKAMENEDWPSHEHLATAIMQDINNQLVPRWVQVVTSIGGDGHPPDHKVMVEDKQPQWANAGLLAHLDPI